MTMPIEVIMTTGTPTGVFTTTSRKIREEDSRIVRQFIAFCVLHRHQLTFHEVTPSEYEARAYREMADEMLDIARASRSAQIRALPEE